MMESVNYDKNNGNRLITSIPMTKNRLVPLKFGGEGGKLANVVAHGVIAENKTRLWHLRFGHLNFGSMKLLTSHQMVCGFLK